MQTDPRIQELDEFKGILKSYLQSGEETHRSSLNRKIPRIKKLLAEANCYFYMTITPPPAVGGLIARNQDPFDLLFNPPYGRSPAPLIIDALDKAIGVFEAEPDTTAATASADKAAAASSSAEPVKQGQLFIAMPINPSDHALVDVLESIQQAASACGLTAYRIDEQQSNERITDRILEGIRESEYIVADLTNARPNVFYEAGYALGKGKLPIYIARDGTHLEFDLKDYPVIFFKNQRELREGLIARLTGLMQRKN
ncbi:hypothetical protein [Stenotrophomonas hibiscicola]